MSLQGEIAVESAVRQILGLIDDTIIAYHKNKAIVAVLIKLRKEIKEVPYTTIKEKACVLCDFLRIVNEKIVFCSLIGVPYRELGQVCPKELGVQELKEACRYHLTLEGTIEGEKEVCRAHLLEGGRHPCWVKSLEDLLTDPDFLTTEVVTENLQRRALIEM